MFAHLWGRGGGGGGKNIPFKKRCGEISIIKMFNPNLKENKSYNMDFKHTNTTYMPC